MSGVVVADPDGSNLATVNVSGQLNVVTSPPAAPPTSVAVNVKEVSVVTGNNNVDHVYTIPSGKSLTLQRMVGGAGAGSTGVRQSKVELWHAPDGSVNGNATLLRVMYLSGSNYEYVLVDEYTGDGTLAIILRRERSDAENVEVFGAWDGYRDA